MHPSCFGLPDLNSREMVRIARASAAELTPIVRIVCYDGGQNRSCMISESFHERTARVISANGIDGNCSAFREPKTRRESLSRRLAHRVWGYDYFISYHWESGGRYAVALAQRLLDRGFDCFLDRADYAMGDDWKLQGERALRHTQRLVLIATREAVAQSSPVAREVEIFTERSNHVIPIVFGDRFTVAERQMFVILRRLPDSKLDILERLQHLESGPSQSVIDQLVQRIACYAAVRYGVRSLQL